MRLLLIVSKAIPKGRPHGMFSSLFELSKQLNLLTSSSPRHFLLTARFSEACQRFNFPTRNFNNSVVPERCVNDSIPVL